MGKLNKDLVEQIYIELREGTTSSNIAIEFGITRQAVYDINTGQSHAIEGMEYPIRTKKKPLKTYQVDGFHHIWSETYPSNPKRNKGKTAGIGYTLPETYRILYPQGAK